MKIAIIGAGFSGCNLFNNLKDKYENITNVDCAQNELKVRFRKKKRCISASCVS